jgi:CRP-like cAMP-binding protein
MQNKLSILKNAPLFMQINEEDIMEILGCLLAKEKNYNKDEYILSAENQTNDVGIVLTGSVRVINEDYWGNTSILTKLGPGEMFGEAFASAEVDKLPVSVIANGECTVLFINYRKIITTCASDCGFHNQLIRNMIKILASKNVMLTQKLEHMGKRTTREKLLSYLSSEAKKIETNYFVISYNRQELADYLSVDRSAMSNELCKLRDEGLIEFHKNEFRLL